MSTDGAWKDIVDETGMKTVDKTGINEIQSTLTFTEIAMDRSGTYHCRAKTISQPHGHYLYPDSAVFNVDVKSQLVALLKGSRKKVSCGINAY